MENTKMLRAFITCGAAAIVLLLSGCAMLENKPQGSNPSAAAETAYYTCGGCHGPEGVRVEYMSPNIIGQKKGYLAAKLRDFRDSKRINPYMNGVVSGLSDQEINDLAAYYSTNGQSKK